jgi:serine/threonine-protein kinase
VNPGDLISGKYRLLRPLGAGGMGSVWAARNELTDRDFAIKFLLPDLAKNKEALSRFFHEARACGQIKHPAVVDVYDMGQTEDGRPFLVMELLEGEGFDARLARAGTFPPADACAWVAFIARGLEEAHVRGLVHRDLKPQNIFFALDDRGDVVPKLLDFGVSKATGVKSGADFVKTTTGAVLGSPAYMSPEQAQGETNVDGRSDVWALGVILYEALTGQIPFDAPNYNALMMTIMMRAHRPVLELAPHVPIELGALIDHTLSKDKTARVGTARELADRLDAVVQRLGAGHAYPQFQPRVTALGSPSMPQGYPSVPGPSSFPGGYPSAPSHPSLPGAPGVFTPAPGSGGDPPRVHGTTQGPWSDARPTLRRRTGASVAVWIAAALLFTSLIGGGFLAWLRMRAPMAALAGRSAAALGNGLSRLSSEVTRLQDEAAAAERARLEAETKAKATSKPVQVLDDDKPRGPRPTGGRPPRRPSGNDPHGGVDGAGF